MSKPVNLETCMYCKKTCWDDANSFHICLEQSGGKEADQREKIDLYADACGSFRGDNVYHYNKEAR